ncbi:hypothetical protein [Kitasatospora sp. NPDC004531]
MIATLRTGLALVAQFTDPALATAWYAARRTAMDTGLAAVAASRWADHLVLRGSAPPPANPATWTSSSPPPT